MQKYIFKLLGEIYYACKKYILVTDPVPNKAYGELLSAKEVGLGTPPW